MGNPRALYYACAITAGLLLASCDDAPQRWRKSEIQDIARQASPQPYGEAASAEDFAALQAEIASLKEQIELLTRSRDLAIEADDLTNQRIDGANDRLTTIEDTLYR